MAPSTKRAFELVVGDRVQLMALPDPETVTETEVDVDDGVVRVRFAEIEHPRWYSLSWPFKVAP